MAPAAASAAAMNGGGDERGLFRGRYKFVVLLTLYFAQGLPWRFIAISVPVVMRRYGVGLDYIGLFSLVALPMSIKFLWSPYVDRWGSSRFGHYKSWIFPLQLGSFASMLVMSQLDPNTQMLTIVLIVLAFSLFAATQDIGCDGLAVRSLTPEERPVGNTIATAGTILGAFVGGAVTLSLLDRVGWTWAVIITATTLLIPLLFLWPYTEPTVTAEERLSVSLASLWAMFKRPGMTAWILLMTFFLMGSAFVNPMVRPLLVDQGMSNSQIGIILGVVEPLSTLGGLLTVPFLIGRLGRGGTLIACGLLQGFAMALYIPVALGWWGFLEISLAYGLEGFAGGLVIVTIYTVCMDKSEHVTAGTDFTTQFSLMTLIRFIPLTMSGYMAEIVGYTWLFATGVVIHLLGLAAFARYMAHVRLVDRPLPFAPGT